MFRIMYQELSEKGLQPEVRHVLFSISKLICYTEQKASLKQAPVGILQFLQYFYTDRFKAVLLLWFLTVTCSCCPYLYFGSAIMLVAYFVNFR